MVKSFDHTCVVVSDLNRSLRFYKALLGLEVAKRLAVKGAYLETVLGVKGAELVYVKMRCPNQPEGMPDVFEVHFWKTPKRPPVKGYGHVSFIVEDIDAEYARLRKRGVRFLSAPARSPGGDTKICFCMDPDGNRIEFIEDLKRRL